MRCFGGYDPCLIRKQRSSHPHLLHRSSSFVSPAQQPSRKLRQEVFWAQYTTPRAPLYPMPRSRSRIRPKELFLPNRLMPAATITFPFSSPGLTPCRLRCRVSNAAFPVMSFWILTRKPAWISILKPVGPPKPYKSTPSLLCFASIVQNLARSLASNRCKTYP